MGFIPNIVDVLNKYDLWNYYATYITDGSFLSKHTCHYWTHAR